jgi:hypothetical protein
MRQFSIVLREYTNWLTSIRWVNVIMPFHLYIMFGGVGLLFLSDLLILMGYYQTFVYTIGHYAFFLGIILSLATPDKKYIPYVMWAYVIVLLFPFKYFSLYQIIESFIYIVLGYWFLKYEAGDNTTQR